MTYHHRATARPIATGNPLPTSAQVSYRGLALVASRDMGNRLAKRDVADVLVEGLVLAGWTADDIEELGNKVGRAAGEIHRNALRARREARA